MGVPGTHTIDRRDAVVAAALSGTVLVILGYASGVGLRTTSEVAATLPPTTSTPAPTESTAAAQALTPMAMQPVAQMPAMPMAAAHSTVAMPSPTHSMPMPTTSPTPTSTPTPSGADCSTGPLDSLTGALPLVDQVVPLVTQLVGSVPLLGQILAPTSGQGSGLLGCSLRTSTAGATP
jgi:hypothetical protein